MIAWRSFFEKCQSKNVPVQFNKIRIWSQNDFQLVFDVSALFIEYSSHDQKSFVTGEPLLIILFTYSPINKMINVVVNGAFESRLVVTFEETFYNGLKRRTSSLMAFVKAIVHACAKLETVFFR